MNTNHPDVPVESGTTTDFDTHAPRHLNASQNLILTIKLLVVFALLGAALWGLDMWTSAR